ncbi:hypothetical protein ACJQWK_05772 [Exserohilum turcicum]|uniref:Uncharacterized protein n=1 Tax=Exserohilum turcicum (strain 28A) TaxID=671987 RepID=R0K7X7_EXST2|nr:uncharacterized protein SETTUDRAFT_38373 [Exserohilum turcica Et28A]EOA89068.1 hypothetical protein SETTUDRAFT_38373 [Exserohilum turcica Et28A]
MRFSNIFISLATAAGLVPITVASNPEVPDGTYSITHQEDGSYLWKSLTNATMEPITTFPQRNGKPKTYSAKFQKRRTDCWGQDLDHAGVDKSANDLRRWARQPGGFNWAATYAASSVGSVVNFVFVYYCITTPHTSGNIDENDVNYALAQMDAKCPLYRASWFGWDGSSELIGKASVNAEICTGPF